MPKHAQSIVVARHEVTLGTPPPRRCHIDPDIQSAYLRDFWSLPAPTRSRLARRKPHYVVRDGELVQVLPQQTSKEGSAR